MKVSSLFALFAVAAAGGDGDGDGGASQQAASNSQQQQQQGTSQQQSRGSDQSQGYGDEAAEQDSYGGEEQSSYGAESYSNEGEAYPPVGYKPKTCVGLCPPEAPFYNLDTGACAPGICNYAAPASYAGAPSGYRRLGGESDNTYGYEAPAQEAAPAAQEYSAAPAAYSTEAEPRCESLSAPHGNYVDTRNNRVSRSGTIALWVGFVLLFLPAVYYINRYLFYTYIVDEGKDHRIGSKVGKAVLKFLAEPSLICGVVCFIASLAYLAMATHHGFYVRCCDGREFYYARYLDWIITTPLMLHALCYLGGFDDDMWHFLFFQDILMIAAGLIGSTVCTSDKWIFFAFSMLNFLPIIYYLCQRKNRAIDNNIYDAAGNKKVELKDGAVLPHIWFLVSFNNAMRLTVLAWCLYPVVWILAEGTGTISSNGEAIFYTVLDVIAKTGFGFIISTSKRNTLQQVQAAGFKLLNTEAAFLEKLEKAVKGAITAVVKGGSSDL